MFSVVQKLDHHLGDRYTLCAVPIDGHGCRPGFGSVDVAEPSFLWHLSENEQADLKNNLPKLWHRSES